MSQSHYSLPVGCAPILVDLAVADSAASMRSKDHPTLMICWPAWSIQVSLGVDSEGLTRQHETQTSIAVTCSIPSDSAFQFSFLLKMVSLPQNFHSFKWLTNILILTISVSVSLTNFGSFFVSPHNNGCGS